jgi:hypothetical protein
MLIKPIVLVDNGTGVFVNKTVPRSPKSTTGRRESSRQARPR